MTERRRSGGKYSGVDRRRAGPPGQPPSDTLMQMPASVLLERLPQPVLAVAHDGTILFANAAFCDMLGYPKEAVLSLNIDQIVGKVDGHSAVVPLQRRAHELVKLLCRDGFVVPATMSAETLGSPDDCVALLAFNEQATEQLWNTGRGLRH